MRAADNADTAGSGTIALSDYTIGNMVNFVSALFCPLIALLRLKDTSALLFCLHMSSLLTM